MKLGRCHVGALVGIRTNNVIYAKASHFEGLRYMQGGHRSVWCDRVTERRDCAEVRVWAHLNRK